MSLLDEIRDDVNDIINNEDEFAIAVTIRKDDYTIADVFGTFGKHHTKINGEGMVINSRSTSITITEKALLDAGYPVRDSDGLVDLIGHIITFKDSTGENKTYTVREQYPDETLGIIPLILDTYAAN